MKPPERHVRSGGHRVTHHQVSHAEAGERLARQQVPVLGAGGLEEEPADEGQPGAAEGALEDEQAETHGDEDVAEGASNPGRDARGPCEVVPSGPEGRSQHSPTVERERREKIEDEECQVDVAEPGGGAVHRLRRRREPGEEHEEDAEHEGDDRSGDRNPELSARTRKHALEPGHTSEEPERDAVDLHSLPACDERVPVLVHEQRDEEEQCRRDRHAEVRAIGQSRVHAREDRLGERPDDQREDDEPAPVDADPDPGDATQRDAVVHGTTRLPGFARGLHGRVGMLGEGRPVLSCGFCRPRSRTFRRCSGGRRFQPCRASKRSLMYAGTRSPF